MRTGGSATVSRKYYRYGTRRARRPCRGVCVLGEGGGAGASLRCRHAAQWLLRVGYGGPYGWQALGVCWWGGGWGS
jgi:hypothetical protein